MRTASSGGFGRTVSLSSIALLLANLASLAAAVFFGWSVFELLMLFWAETVLIGLLVVLRLGTMGLRRKLRWMPSLILGFLLIFTAFVSAHLLLLLGLFKPEDSDWFPLSLALPLLALAISHVLSYATEFIGQRGYLYLDPQTLAFQPFKRVVVMQVTLILGGMLAMEMAEPLYALAVLMLLKIGLDAGGGRRQRRAHDPHAEFLVCGDWDDERFLPRGTLSRSPETTPRTSASDDTETRAARFLDRVRPIVDELKAENARIARTAWGLLIGMALLGGLIGLIVGMSSPEWDTRLSAGLSLLAGAAIAAWLLAPGQARWKQRILDAVLPEICEHVGELEYQAEVPSDALLRAFARVGILDESCGKLEHHFRGRYRGLGFECVNAEVYFKPGRLFNRNSYHFEGLLYRIQLPMIVERPILIMPKRRLIRHNDTSRLLRIQLDDAAFDDRFEVYVQPGAADDAAVVATLLSPEARQAVLELAHGGGKLDGFSRMSFALAQDSLYLVVWRFGWQTLPGGTEYQVLNSFLGLPLYIKRDPALEQRIANLAEDISEVHRIMDRLPWTRLEVSARSTKA